MSSEVPDPESTSGDLDPADVTFPAKRTTGDTVEDILTSNAFNNILPARYLKKNADGEIVEDPENFFERVAKNIALAEVVYAADEADTDVTVTPDQLKPDHPRRDELAAEVFGAGTTADDDVEATLTEDNVKHFAYDTVVPTLDDGLVDTVTEWKSRYQDAMEQLKWMPNSPTLMNAGDELQQLSACFVNSPEDDIGDIHETAKEAALIFQSGGGVGYAFHHLRPYGDAVGSTGGIASGPITFMRTYDRMCQTIAQGGARRGAQMGVMRVSHPDVIQFIHAKNKDVSLAHTLRLNDPDDFTHNSFQEALEEARELIDDDGKVPEHLRNAVEGHLSNFNISVGITDDFMAAVKADEKFTFTNPRTGEPHIATAETKELYEMFDLGEHVTVGEELSVPAQAIWTDIVEGAHENGEPGVIYLERVNKEHSFDVEKHPEHRIHATNPCLTGETEILLGDGTTARLDELAQGVSNTVVDSPDIRTRDAETASPTTAPGINPRCTERSADIIRVVTESGSTIKCTPDHEIWTPKQTYVEAETLEPGDQICGLRRNSAEGLTSPVQTALTVAYTEPAGTADVYNITVEEHHNYYAKTTGEQYINVANCGEQPLEENEACNLGHINLSTIAVRDGPQWADWEPTADDATLETQVELFLEDAIDFDELDDRVELGTRFLDNVVTMSNFPTEAISQKVTDLRKVGLGIMGLAQLYPQLGVKYGSDVGDEIARQLMRHINHQSKAVSNALAEQRGTFNDWEISKYADPVEYRSWFENQTGEAADDYADGGFKMRNHNTTTTAPTGTTSMLGNTSGGCEPIYSVAYYKNVSGDVQGDEMLVEFDDYFLRVLEANDIPVDPVRKEAEQQMNSNEYDGISGLETVPDAIGKLFVTTSDLTARQHASVQVACQEGVDSAISKTTNAPNDSTVEDAKEVFEYIYDHGGKGVTYYRDGTRSKQVLTTRAQNTEFADMDETEAAEAIVTNIESIFGGIDGFLESEDVQTQLETDLEELLADDTGLGTKQPRPDVLHGVTQRIDTGYGKLYVNINEDPETGDPFELFANIGNSGGFSSSFTEALAKTISTALRCGVDPYEIASELQGIRSPKVAWDKGDEVDSIPDAIGIALERYLEGEIQNGHPDQATLDQTAHEAPGDDTDDDADQPADPVAPEPDGGAADAGAATDQSPGQQADATQKLVDAGELPECKDCGSDQLHIAEGCVTCQDCGWSKC